MKNLQNNKDLGSAVLSSYIYFVAAQINQMIGWASFIPCDSNYLLSQIVCGGKFVLDALDTKIPQISPFLAVQMFH